MLARDIFVFGGIALGWSLGMVGNICSTLGSQMLIYSVTNRSVTATALTANSLGPNNDTQTLTDAKTGAFDQTATASATENGETGKPVTGTASQNSRIDSSGFSGTGSFTGGIGAQPNELMADSGGGSASFDTTFTVNAPTAFLLDVSFTGGSLPTELGAIDMQSASFTLKQGATTIDQGTMPANPTDIFPPPTTTFNDTGFFQPGKAYSFSLTSSLQVADSAGETFPQYSFKLEAVPVPPASEMAMVTLATIGAMAIFKRGRAC